MLEQRYPRPTRRTQYEPVRSTRISDSIWKAAKKRADADDVTMTHVLSLLTEMYAKGLVKLPTVEITYPELQAVELPEE